MNSTLDKQTKEKEEALATLTKTKEDLLAKETELFKLQESQTANAG